MWAHSSGLADTGERVIPDAIDPTDQLAVQLFNQHLRRYEHAARFACGAEVLDVACGTGYGALILAGAGADSVVALDPDEQVIQYARQRYPSDVVDYRAQFVEELSSTGFDLIASFETIEHTDKPSEFLEALTRHLRPGGRLMVSATTVPTTDLYPFHKHDYDPDGFRALCRSTGLEIVDEVCQVFKATPRDVRVSMGVRRVLPAANRIAANPLRVIARLADASLFSGLSYENLTLVLTHRDQDCAQPEGHRTDNGCSADLCGRHTLS